MRSILGIVIASVIGFALTGSAHAEYCRGPYGWQQYPSQVCHQARRPLPIIGMLQRQFEQRRHYEQYRRYEQHRRFERTVVRHHEVIRRTERPEGPTIVTHHVEFEDGQSYCSKYAPGTRFVHWNGSGRSRTAHCE